MPSDSSTQAEALGWANETWALAPKTRACVVWFAETNARGRRTKPSVERAKRQLRDAAQQGDLNAANAVIASISELGGVAWCESVDQLASALADRIRHGQVCWVEEFVTEQFVSLVCWRG